MPESGSFACEGPAIGTSPLTLPRGFGGVFGGVFGGATGTRSAYLGLGASGGGGTGEGGVDARREGPGGAVSLRPAGLSTHLGFAGIMGRGDGCAGSCSAFSSATMASACSRALSETSSAT